MKAVYALPLALLLGACGLRLGGTMNITTVKAELVKLAEKDLGLKDRVPCPLQVQEEEGVLCYAPPYDAEEFGARVDALDRTVLRPITGWRDDYGVMSGVYEYKNQPYEVGLSFARMGEGWLWQGPEFAAIRKAGASGYVTLSVSDEPPRDR